MNLGHSKSMLLAVPVLFCIIIPLFIGTSFAITPLRTLAEQRGIEIRTAVHEGALLEDQVYVEALAPNFNMMSPGLSLLFNNLVRLYQINNPTIRYSHA